MSALESLYNFASRQECLCSVRPTAGREISRHQGPDMCNSASEIIDKKTQKHKYTDFCVTDHFEIVYLYLNLIPTPLISEK